MAEPQFPLRVFLDESGPFPSKDGTPKLQSYAGVCVYGAGTERELEAEWNAWRADAGLAAGDKSAGWRPETWMRFANFLVERGDRTVPFGTFVRYTKEVVRDAESRMKEWHDLARSLPSVEPDLLRRLRIRPAELLWQYAIQQCVPPVVVSALPDLGIVDELRFVIDARDMHVFAKHLLEGDFASYTSEEMLRTALAGRTISTELDLRIARNARWGDRVSVELDAASSGVQIADAMAGLVRRSAENQADAMEALDALRTGARLHAARRGRSYHHAPFLAQDSTDAVRFAIGQPTPARDEIVAYVREHPIPRARIEALQAEVRPKSRRARDGPRSGAAIE